jgi:hypothetical protein
MSPREDKNSPVWGLPRGKVQWTGHCASGYARWRDPMPDRRRLTASRYMENNMRTFVRLAGAAGALALAACGGSDKVSDDFQRDLDRASTASEITLPQAQTATQVVSSIERMTPPAPRRVAPSQRVAKHKPAPTREPAPVEVEQADVSTEVEPAPVEPSPAPVAEAPLPSPRPRPVASAGGAGDGQGGIGSGDSGRGGTIGTIIGVVLRGGVVDGDDCDPRSEGRPRGGISINNRIPVIGTFPGSGRVGGAINMPVMRRGRF